MTIEVLAQAGFDTKIQIVAVVATVLGFLLVLELVRRRRLIERYALLWIGAAAALLVLAVWRDGLNTIADLLGVAYPPNAIFLLAFAVTLTLLLHFSVAISRLSDETKILAQEVARLDHELRAMRESGSNGQRDPAAGQGGGEALNELREGPAADLGEARPGPASSNPEARPE